MGVVGDLGRGLFVRRLNGWFVVGLVMLSGTMLTGSWICAWGQSAAAGQASASEAPAGQAGVTASVAASVAMGGMIRGTVKAGAVPLPGVAVTATNTLTGKKYATTTDIDGAFAMTIPRNGRYVVKAELAAFATETKEVVVDSAGLHGGKADQVAEFGMQLASRVAEEEAQQAGTASALAGLMQRGTQALS